MNTNFDTMRTTLLSLAQEAGREAGRLVETTEADCPYSGQRADLREAWLAGFAEQHRHTEGELA